MDNQNTNQSLFTLRISENTKMQLKGAAVLAGVAAIFSLASSILNLIKAFMDRNKTTLEYNFEGFNQTRVSAERTGSIVSTIITLAISILLFYFLNRFSSQTKAGLNANNQQLVNSGLGGLSAYFVTIGIILIICLAFLLLALMVGISAGGR
jgi:hypothetical protein